MDIYINHKKCEQLAKFEISRGPDPAGNFFVTYIGYNSSAIGDPTFLRYIGLINMIYEYCIHSPFFYTQQNESIILVDSAHTMNI
jgi:hypothetical protein